MQMLYNSDSYAVVQFDVPAVQGLAAGSDDALTRGGFEIGIHADQLGLHDHQHEGGAEGSMRQHHRQQAAFEIQ